MVLVFPIFRTINIWVACVFLMVSYFANSSAMATILDEEFDARPLSVAEKRYVQAALAFEGAYFGLLDGEWGRLSQRALDGYALRRYGIKPTFRHVVEIIETIERKSRDEGWEVVHLDHFEVSMLMPLSILRQEIDAPLNNLWITYDETLLFGVAWESTAEMLAAHSHFQAEYLVSDLYKVRRDKRIVTSGNTKGGRFYKRSERVKGLWMSITLIAQRSRIKDLNAVSTSIEVGRANRLSISRIGYLQGLIDIAKASGEPRSAKPKVEIPSVATTVPKTQNTVKSTGSAFVVNDAGVALTNSHVVEGCGAITLDGVPAKVLATSNIFDLAILRTEGVGVFRKPLEFSDRVAELNSDVTIAGFPLHGLLGGLNVTRGAVTSAVGLGGNALQMQISAAVHPGNSGGPVVDARGNLVGVVVSKLDAKAYADATGDVAQNVNFAIRGEIAQLFLGQNGVSFIKSKNQKRIDSVSLAKNLKRATQLVTCH